MFRPYLADNARESADQYYHALNNLFELIRLEAKRGAYSFVISFDAIDKQQVEYIQKCGYDVKETSDGETKNYIISWDRNPK